jgi:hypothetical protein
VHDGVGRLDTGRKKVLIDVTARHEALAILALNRAEDLERLVDLVVGHFACTNLHAKNPFNFFGVNHAKQKRAFRRFFVFLGFFGVSLPA